MLVTDGGRSRDKGAEKKETRECTREERHLAQPAMSSLIDTSSGHLNNRISLMFILTVPLRKIFMQHGHCRRSTMNDVMDSRRFANAISFQKSLKSVGELFYDY